jgi:hypothetical protein
LLKNNQTYNFLHLNTTSDLDELEKFKNDAIKKINLEKWIDDYKTGKCMYGGNYIYIFEDFNK